MGSGNQTTEGKKKMAESSRKKRLRIANVSANLEKTKGTYSESLRGLWMAIIVTRKKILNQQQADLIQERHVNVMMPQMEATL